jgi:chromosomal replication initiator protein
MIMVDLIWNQFLAIAREEVGSRVVETWFKAISLQRWDPTTTTVIIFVPNEFIKSWVESNYTKLLRTHLARLLQVEELTVLFSNAVHEETEPTIMPAASPAKIIPAQGLQGTKVSLRNTQAQAFDPKSKSSGIALNPNYVFENFVVAQSNSLAYAAAYAVTEKPGQIYNPLFIYGRSGLGKTHLLHAIANKVKKQSGGAFVMYQSADRFVQEFINAIRFDTVHNFQSKYQAADVLLIDDIQFMANKEQTQEAFFQIFNLLYDAQKQIVFSSDTFPQNIDGIAERLRSRLACGLVTDVYMPSLETKVAILKKKATQHAMTLPDDVADFVASHVNSNIRELEGALIRVFAFASLTKQPVTLELAEAVFFRTMNTAATADQSEGADVERILKCVQKYYKYNLNDLRLKNRNKDLVFARQLCMFLMSKYAHKSLRDIGAYLGSINHATVKHGVCKIEEHARENKDFGFQLKRIEQEIYEK